MTERSADILDQASEWEARFHEASQRTVRERAAPEKFRDETGLLLEQVPYKDGTYPFPDCVEETCGEELPTERLALGRIRCVGCQTEIERGKNGR